MFRFLCPFPNDTDPLLVTVALDGTVLLHKVVLWKHDSIVAGRLPSMSRPYASETQGNITAIRSKNAKSPTYKNDEGYGVALAFEKAMELPESHPEDRILTVIVYKHRNHNCVVATGHSDGTVLFNARNGSIVKVSVMTERGWCRELTWIQRIPFLSTLLFPLQAHYVGSPVYAMQKSGNMIAHTHRRYVILQRTDMNHIREQRLMCPFVFLHVALSVMSTSWELYRWNLFKCFVVEDTAV